MASPFTTPPLGAAEVCVFVTVTVRTSAALSPPHAARPTVARAHARADHIFTMTRCSRICARLALPRMRISQAQLDEAIAHAQADAPNECCGYMSLKDGVVEQVFRAEN